jgi:mitogen-activated protein kinase kinase 1 interacting protein 1
MGKNKTITSFYENKVIVHINHMPLVISLIGDKQVNVGVLLSFAADIKKALEPLKNSIKESNEDMS